MANIDIIHGTSVAVRGSRGLDVIHGTSVARVSGTAVDFSKIENCIYIDEDIIDAEFEVSAESEVAGSWARESRTERPVRASAAHAAAKIGFSLKELKDEFKYADANWTLKILEDFQYLGKISASEATALKRELGL